MNIETANRLYELRKKNNLSQEELAEKLGISRQAVSKWERAEASPDTDNLILLAKLYGVSLDELLSLENAKAYEEENHEIKEEPKEDSFHFEDDALVLESEDGETCKITHDGIVATDKDGNVTKKSFKELHKEKIHPVKDGIIGGYAILAVIAYLLLGFNIEQGWACYWVLFLGIPVLASLFDCYYKKRFCAFAYPVLIVAVYCFLGMRFSTLQYTIFNQSYVGFWHPGWILFITIPLYYIIFGGIDRAIHGDEEEEED